MPIARQAQMTQYFDNKSFTLVELMIAAAILIIVLCGILATYVSCMELISISKNLSFAVNSAQCKIEEIRDYSFSKIYNDYNRQTFTVSEIIAGNSKGVVYIDNSTADLLKVTVSVCWKQRGNRIIGEDLDLDGILDTGEDTNNNNMIDSPAQLVTLIASR